ncbi:MAG: glycosyltransferase family 4 protein [Candidatus Obscuribacterales bacterium]|nr:glycosyltransferase family 4 protein [Candidatus Obscuribacterales bacterium]
MRIAFVSTYDSSDINKWSGIAFHMYKALADAGVDLVPIFPLQFRTNLTQKLLRKIYSHLFGKKYSAAFETNVLRHCAKQIQRRLQESGPVDAIVVPGSLPIATTYLKCGIPVFVWGDGTFEDLLNWYDEFTNFCQRTIFFGQQSQKEQLTNTTRTIYCAPLFVQTAISRYDTDNERLAVIPFGANTVPNLSRDEISQFIRQRPHNRCRLLFIGLDWKRKQGDWAVATAEELTRRGLPIELTVVGARPTSPDPLPQFVKYHGFIDKSTESGKDELMQLLLNSHFLILPTKADTFGIVFCEASACGTPSLSTQIGGVSAAVADGQNGKLFPCQRSTFIEECSNYVMAMMQDQKKYEQLCLSSFDRYTTDLNWRASVTTLLNLIETHIANH